MGRVLIASAKTERRRYLRSALESEGHNTAEVVNGFAAFDEAATGTWDLLILDSDIDASVCALCRRIRQLCGLGILILFPDSGDESRIDVLNAGADDYLPGRFVLPELHARVRAILRRVGNPDEMHGPVVLKDRAIDFRSRKIEGPGSRSTHLTPKEYLVLKCLMTSADKPVNHRELAQTVWHRDGSGDLEYVRIVINQLRRKIEPDYNSPRYIITERSVGYRFTAAEHGSDNQAMAR
jgi:two-component system KDP operon response regulator KdpE